MGDIADMMLDGTLCEGCGVYIEGEAPGYPRHCSAQCRTDCSPAVAPKSQPIAKVKCPICKRKVKHNGLADHMRDAHTKRLTDEEKVKKTLGVNHPNMKAIHNDWKKP